MNTSAFRDLWARVMFWKFSKLHEQFENFQNITSDHKSRNALVFIRFFIYYILDKITFIEFFVLVFFHFWVYFSLSRPCLPDIWPGLCSFQCVFVFCIFFKFLNDVLVWQSKPVVSYFFIIWCSNLALPQCFHGNFSVLHSITSIALYNLFMHSSLTNQKCDILLSI